MASNENKNSDFYQQHKAPLVEESKKDFCKKDGMTTDFSTIVNVVYASLFTKNSDFQFERNSRLKKPLPKFEDTFKNLKFKNNLKTPMDVTDDCPGFTKRNLLTESPIDKGLDYLMKTSDDSVKMTKHNASTEATANDGQIQETKETYTESNINYFKCNICNAFQSLTEWEIKNHLKSYHDVCDFICHACDWACDSFSLFIEHRMLKHREHFECNVCHAVFQSGNDLIEHKRRNH